MSAEPTPAVAAACEVVGRAFAAGRIEFDQVDFGSAGAELAEALVAAVRPILFEEVAERMLQHAQDAEDNDATEGAVYTFMVAADRIRDWACRPLSLPASKETPDGN